MQRCGDRGAVRREAIGGDLETRRARRMAHAFDENIRGALVALAHRDVEHQLGVAFDRDEGVAVAEVLDHLRDGRVFVSCR